MVGNNPTFVYHFILNIMRVLLQIVFILAFTIPLSSQDIKETDSLELRLAVENDPVNKIEILEKISRNLLFVDIKKALEYAEEALHVSDEIGNTMAKMNSILLLSEIYWTKTEYMEAMRLAVLATELAEEYHDRKSLARSYLIIGTIFLRIDNYNKSLEYYFKSLKIFREIDEKGFTSTVLNNIGSAYSDQQKYDKAIEYFTEALSIGEACNDSTKIELCISNIASILLTTGEYHKAKKMMENAMRIRRVGLLNNWYGINMLNLALVYSKLNQYDSAIILFNEALTIFNKMEHESNKALFYYNYGHFFFENKEYDKSVVYATIAFNKSRKYDFPDNACESAALLSDSYFELNNLEEAYKYAKIEIQLKDSLYAVRSDAAISNYELQYEFDLEQQEKKLEQQRRDYIVIILIIFFIAVIMVGVLVFARQREKAKNILLDKQNLKTELDFKNKEFASSVLTSMKKNEALSGILEKIIQIEEKSQNLEIKQAIHYIGNELKKSSEHDLWKEFDIRFKEVHTDFYKKLAIHFPDLTANDIKLCAFLKLNLSSKEISGVTGQRVATLEAARSRIRKKLGISKTPIDLVTFLSKY